MNANVRIAIYDTSLNLLFQGSAEIPVTDADIPAWYTHTSFVDEVGSPAVDPQIIGGTEYIFAFTCDNPLTLYRLQGASGVGKYISTDYTAAFPDPIGAGSDSGTQACVRCGVEPTAGGGSIIPLLIDEARRRIKPFIFGVLFAILSSLGIYFMVGGKA